MSAIDLRLGDYRDVLADVECDLLCVDAPYSERTHAAYSPRTGVLTACVRDARWAAKGGKRREINYSGWSPEMVDAFVDSWSPRTRGWFVSITDDVLAPAWQSALRRHDRYVFAQLPFVAPGSRVRLAGDGPSSWTCWLVIAARPRDREFHKWGTLRGAYVLPRAEEIPVIGGKPPWLMRELVKDYSRPGDLVCDPCAGGATTLIAAAIEGRRAIGAELDPNTHVMAMRRIQGGNAYAREPKQGLL